MKKKHIHSTRYRPEAIRQFLQDMRLGKTWRKAGKTCIASRTSTCKNLSFIHKRLMQCF